MAIDDSKKYGSFASLNLYSMLNEFSKSTKEQADKAILSLCNFYGAESEEQILNCGDYELIETFNKVKLEILKRTEE